MPRYAVPLVATISTIVILEAPDVETAIDRALENGPQTDLAYSGFDADEWQVEEAWSDRDYGVEETTASLSPWVYHEDYSDDR